MCIVNINTKIMNKQVSCTLCGESKFYKDGGHYYCKECNTQTQDLKEQVVDLSASQNYQTTTRVQKKRTQKDNLQALTTWECYNYIMLGWVDRLIELGASKDLKPTTQILWLKYLKQIEALGRYSTDVPRMHCIKFERDAEILHGRPYRTKKKRVKKRKLDKDSASVSKDSSTSRRLRSKLINETISSSRNATSDENDDSTTLQNRSLSSLQSSITDNKKLKFNSNAKRELKSALGSEKYKDFVSDVNNTLGIKVSKKMFSSEVKHTSTYVEVLSRQKALSIVYLALLMTNDKIQLADMMRFINEGFITVVRCDEYFPEGLEYSAIAGDMGPSFKQWHSSYRKTACKISTFLNIQNLIKLQNLVSLTKRYCKELNLPVQIEDYVLNIISRTNMKLEIQDQIPNYEGRVMSFIIFAMKIFFGLDGVSEFNFSDLAENLNKQGHDMFSFRQWLKHINYRRKVITEHHFTTQYVTKNHPRSTETYVHFMRNRLEGLEISEEYEDIEQLLEDLPNELPKSNLEFTPSLTPLYDYTIAILDSGLVEKNGYIEEYLIPNFQKTSMQYLITPEKYLHETVDVAHRSANDNFQVAPITPYKLVWSDKITCKIARRCRKSGNYTPKALPQPDCPSATDILNCFEECHWQKLDNYRKQFKADLEGSKKIDGYETHYCPEKRFWLYHIYQGDLQHEEFDKYVCNLPYTFRMLVEECAKIIQHNVREMLEDYMLLEVYMCYVFNEDSGPRTFESKGIDKLIQKALKYW